MVLHSLLTGMVYNTDNDESSGQHLDPAFIYMASFVLTARAVDYSEVAVQQQQQAHAGVPQLEYMVRCVRARTPTHLITYYFSLLLLLIV